LNKRILIITCIIMFVFSFSSICFASENLKIINKQYIVDYKNSDEFYNSIDKAIIENKVGYELEDVERIDNFKTLTKEKEIVEKKVTHTNNLDKVMDLFNKTKDFEEDGYTGTLKRDNSSLKISINDSYQEEYKVYLQKTYENVPSNELNNIPKEIKANGTTYYLVNPVWDIADTDMVSNIEVPIKYNGTMYYEGIKTKTIVTSYLATIKYDGVLEKEVLDTTTFNVKYKEVKEYQQIITAITGTTAIVFVSGIILFNYKNVKVYNLQRGQYKLVKRLHVDKNKLLIDITPTSLQTQAYKIVLSKSLYRNIKGKDLKIKYFDKQNKYNIKNQEFEIIA